MMIINSLNKLIFQNILISKKTYFHKKIKSIHFNSMEIQLIKTILLKMKLKKFKVIYKSTKEKEK
jgi:hypothetical protein